MAIHKNLPSAGGKTSLIRSIHKLSQPWWPALREKYLLEDVNMANDDSASFNIRYFTRTGIRAFHSTIESHEIQNVKLKRN